MRFTRITANAKQMGGVPCIRGLRIPVATVVGMVADGMSEDEILAAYPDLDGFFADLARVWREEVADLYARAGRAKQGQALYDALIYALFRGQAGAKAVELASPSLASYGGRILASAQEARALEGEVGQQIRSRSLQEIIASHLFR